MKRGSITIADRTVGPGQPGYLIAEIGQAHDGSLGTAHAYIDAAAECGVDAVKFQTHIADAESTVDEPFRVRFGSQDSTRLDYWRRMEFPRQAWHELAAHARERGLTFLSSAFSVAAVELLREVGMAAWKVGSGETRSRDLLEAMRATGVPILLSTGMSTLAEIDEQVERLGADGYPLAILQCTSRYPTPPERVGLNVLDRYRERYPIPVGLSDHSGTPWPAVAALARGADLVELHLVLSRGCFGPDVSASLTPEEMHRVVEARDAIQAMLTNPVDKDAEASALAHMRATFGKSLALREDRPAGHRITTDDLTAKKPGDGIEPERATEFVGRRLGKAVPRCRLLREDDFADP